MYIRYYRNFKVVGRDSHRIEISNEYTKDSGLGDITVWYESTRLNDILRFLNSVPEEQLNSLRLLAQEHEDGIVHPSGAITKY